MRVRPILATVMLALAGCSPSATRAAPVAQLSPSPTAVTSTPSLTVESPSPSEPGASPTPAPTPTPTAARLPFVIDWAKLKAVSRARGMTCQKSKLESGETFFYCNRSLRDGSGEVVALKTLDGQTTRLVVDTAFVPKRKADTLARSLFAAIVPAISYEGAEPGVAKAWVLDHIGGSATTTIGPAEFSLSTDLDGNGRILNVSPAS